MGCRNVGYHWEPLDLVDPSLKIEDKSTGMGRELEVSQQLQFPALPEGRRRWRCARNSVQALNQYQAVSSSGSLGCWRDFSSHSLKTCYKYLNQTSWSFAAIIQALNGDLCSSDFPHDGNVMAELCLYITDPTEDISYQAREGIYQFLMNQRGKKPSLNIFNTKELWCWDGQQGPWIEQCSQSGEDMLQEVFCRGDYDGEGNATDINRSFCDEDIIQYDTKISEFGP
ncbi:unnamed protein product [Caretta caretta]